MKKYEQYDIVEKILKNTYYSINDYKNILKKLGDEKSKLSAFYRIMYDNTQDKYYALNLIKLMYYCNNINSIDDRAMFNYLMFMLENNNYKKKLKICYLPSEDINYTKWCLLDLVYCMNNTDYNVYNDNYGFEINLPDYSIYINNINNLEIDKDSIYIIFKNDTNLINYLEKNGISKKYIFIFNTTFELIREYQYFSESFFTFKDNDIFVDGGSYNLETTIQLLNLSEHTIKKIYAFEPIEKNYNNCISLKKEYNLNNIDIINIGLWSKKETKIFSSNTSGAARESKEGNVKIECDSLDNILNGNKVSIIKLDIEGSEAEALNGAKKTIQKYKPILMICIYHKPNDILKLFNIINNIDSNYTYYIRHHSFYDCETVLYAIPKNRLIEY